MSYAEDHASALQDVTEAGAAVTFTRETQTYNAETGVMTTSESTVVGFAIKVPSNPQRFAELGLSLTEAITLLFTPTTFGEVPEPADAVTWNSTAYHVADVDALAPDGTTILSKVVVGK